MSISLTHNIKSILLERTTNGEEAEFISRFSTTEVDVDDTFRHISDIIDYIKNRAFENEVNRIVYERFNDEDDEEYDYYDDEEFDYDNEDEYENEDDYNNKYEYEEQQRRKEEKWEIRQKDIPETIEGKEEKITQEVSLVKYNEFLFKKIWNKILSIFKR